MKTEEFLKIVEGKAGQFIRMHWQRRVKPAAKYKNLFLTKEVSVIVRSGISYNNIQKVQEGRENGTLPEIPQPLPWGSWVKYPLVIEHKGQHYARLTIAQGQVPQVQFYCNGKPLTHEIAMSYLIPSDQKKDHKEDIVINVRMEDLICDE